MKKATLKFKPMILAVTKEREAVYGALKGQFEELQAIANDTALPKKLRLRAMGLAVQVAEAMEGILKDVADDKLLADLERLKKKVREEMRKRKARGTS